MDNPREIYTDCTLCYHSCGTKVTVRDGKAVKIRGLASHPINKGRLCPKGANALDLVYSPDRLKHPLKRTTNGFEKISWEQALDEIAAKLLRLKDRYGAQVFGLFCGSIGVAYTYNVCHCLPFLMLRKKCIEPLGESRSEWHFITALADRLGVEDRFPWASEEEFVAFMVGPSGLSFEYLLNEKPEGDFYAEKKYTIPDKLFRTPTGKIEIYSETLAQKGFDPLPAFLEPERGPVRGDNNFLEKYPLILSVGHRNLCYTHSQQRQVAALKKICPAPLTEIGPETAKKFGIENGDLIVVETNTGQVRMEALVDERVAEGVVLVPHGWGGDANGNLLTDVTCREPIMGYPDQKSLQCAIRKA